jgi:hypothetical protein
MVNDGTSSALTILADSSDSIVVVPLGTESVATLPDPVVAASDATYTIDDGGTVAVINWNVA